MNKIWIIFIISSITVLCAGTTQNSSPYSFCENKLFISKVNYISVSGCDGLDRCLFRKGQDLHLNINFTTLSTVKNPELFLSGILEKEENKLEIQFGKTVSVCSNITGISEKICKEDFLPNGQDFNLSYRVSILKQFPEINVTVRVVLREKVAKTLTRVEKKNWAKHPGRVIFCTLILAKIV